MSLSILFLLACFIIATHALIAPHPDFVDWEPVHAMRRRLNMTYQYSPRYISAEHCRYLTEEECQKEDEQWGLPRSQRRLNPSLGNVRVLVLLVRFTDHTQEKLPSREYFDTLMNGEGKSEINPVGSVKSYVRYMSMTKYNVTFDVQDWETTDNTEAYYAAGVSGQVGAATLQHFFYPILNKLDAQGFDWSKYDSQGWGYLDHLVVIHSGYDANLGDPKGDCNVNYYQNRIWSQGVATTDGGWLSADGAYSVNGFCTASAFGPPLCGEQPAGMGVITHEYQHGFGLIDLYDEDTNDPPINIGGVGRFCLMSNAFGWTRDLTRPGIMSVFSRVAAQWLEPIEITQDGLYPIQPAEISSQIYVIKQGFPEGEYLYIENRQQIKWDENWPASGIVIYHVDEKAPRQTQRGYPGKSGWPSQHYEVSVLQADGLYEIEKGISPGNDGDFWTKGMTLGPGPDWPNTDSYQGGVQKATGIYITVTTDPGYIMLIDVKGLNPGKAPVYYTDDDATPVQEGTAQPYIRNRNTNSSGKILAWVLSMLTGVGLMIGLLVLVL